MDLSIEAAAGLYIYPLAIQIHGQKIGGVAITNLIQP